MHDTVLQCTVVLKMFASCCGSVAIYVIKKYRRCDFVSFT